MSPHLKKLWWVAKPKCGMEPVTNHDRGVRIELLYIQTIEG